MEIELYDMEMEVFDSTVIDETGEELSKRV